MISLPYLDWAFCQPEETGGHPPPPSLTGYFTSDDNETWLAYTIGTNFYKLAKILMTSSLCWFYDVIKIRQLKK